MDVTNHRALNTKMTTQQLVAFFSFMILLQWRQATADQVLFSCNFDTACVNSIQQEKQNDEIDFKVGVGWQGEWSTGPETDHTFKNSTGKYYFIDANANNVRTGDRAVIHLLNDQQRFREGHAQLTLFYHMLDGYGPRNQMGTLNVYTDCGGSRNITWSVDGNQGYNWNEAVIELQCDQQPVQVSIEAVRNGVQSDISIDDVQLIDIFEGDPLPPATHSTLSNVPSSSRSTPPPSRGISGSTLLTRPGMGGTSGRTIMPGGSGSITPPPVGNGSNNGLGLDIIVPIAAAALVALILIIILVIVLIIHRQRKSSKAGGDTLEPPSQLYENNIFADASPDRKYESLQGPLSNSDRIYEELNHKKSTMEMRPKGNPGTRIPLQASRMNSQVPPAMRRSMPELGDNFYDRINDRVNERVVERVPVESMTLNNNTSRGDNSHNSYIDRSQTYHPGVRGSYPEDHPYFTLMPDVVSSTAFQDDRILFTIPPPPSSTPPPLPPPPRDYDYGRPLASGMIEEEELNEYHDVLDPDKRRPLSINSDFDDDDGLGRHRLAMDMVVDRGFEMGSDLRLSRDTDISGRLDLDFDMDVDMRMSADGEADIHNVDTLEMPRAVGYDRGRDRRSRDMEIERNLDDPHSYPHPHPHPQTHPHPHPQTHPHPHPQPHPHPHPQPHLHQRYGGSLSSIDRRRNVVADNDVEQELKDYEHHPSPYHHIEEDPQGHIRMVNLNYSPSVVHV